MISSVVALSIAGLAAASPVSKRWTQSNADCWTFNQDVYAEAMNTDLQLTKTICRPANQTVLAQASIESFQAGSTVMAQIAAAPKIDVKGTYSLYFEYCQPKTGTPAGVFQTVHGLVGNAAYWNVKVEYVLRDRIGVLADWCSGYTDNSFAESAAAAGW
jgi:hypothetical protein